MSLKERCRAITESKPFNRFIIAVILLAGVLVGIETSEELAAKHHTLLVILDKIVLVVFIVEIVMKMIALSPKPLQFFKDPWNCFDFIIVAFCLLPASGGMGPILRLFRLLRTLRLLTAIPKLQILVSALLKSLPSMGYVSLLLFLLFYIYGVAGVMFFGTNDPVHFGTLGDSLLSLFRVVTLEDWTDVMYIQMYGSDGYQGYNFTDSDLAIHDFEPKAQPILGATFFVSFVLIGTMVMLNLVIGVIVNGMDDAKLESEVQRMRETAASLGADGAPSLQDQISELGQQVAGVNATLDRLGKIIETEPDIDHRSTR